MKYAPVLMLVAAVAALPILLAAAPGGGGGGGRPGGGPGRGPGGGFGGGGRGGRGAPNFSATHPAGSPIADGAVPFRVPANFQFTEGPTSDKNGDIYFVDQNSCAIHKWTFDKTSDDPTKGTLSTFLQPSGYSNGMTFDNDGNLITCADEKNALWLIQAPFPPLPAGATSYKPGDLKITVLIKDYDPATKTLNPATGGKYLNGPNDVFVVPAGPLKGAMYITDPLFARQWWQGFRTPASQMPGNYVYLLSADHKSLTPVVTDLRTPNGIIGTPDGKMLYVADMGGTGTFSYTIKDDGTLADKKFICNAPSDGMTLDSDGNIYTTTNNTRTGFQMWSKDGKLLDSLPVGCTNCCFGGKDGNVLLITCVRDVYLVKMKTHRVGPQ